MRWALKADLRDISSEEARELIDILQRVVAGEEVPELREPDPCPWCGSRHVVRKGHDRDGSQRWLCQTCGRTFNLAAYRRIAEQLETAEPGPR